MSRYELTRMPHVTGGPGARHEVGGLASALAGAGSAVLLVADPGLAQTSLPGEVEASLREAGLAPTRFSDFGGDPAAAAADAAAALARRIGARAVVSLGGGSALDLGKAVAAIAGDEAPALHYALAANPLPPRRLASIVVPTTAGTGSEMTRIAILSQDDKAKTWLWSDAIKADEVILDPEATLSLPPALTAATGLDALVHAIEAATNRNATAANNIFAHEAIRLVAGHLERAVSDGKDLPARDALQRAAALAGIAIDNCGTAIAHTAGHALASLRPIHHGRAVALGMVATLRWNVAEDDGRFAAAARAMALAAAVELPGAFERLTRSIGVELSLADGFAGVSPERLADQMSRPENAAMRRSNHRPVGDGDLLAFATTLLNQR